MFSEREQAYQPCLLLIPCGNGGITRTQGIQGADEPGAQRGDSVPVGYVVMPSEHADDASAGQGMVQGGVGCHVCRALLGGGKPAVRFLMALSIVACFFISAPWSGVLFIFGMVVCPCMLYVHVRMGKKSGRASRYRHAECDSEHGDAPGWEAAQLMYGLSRKDHYKDLPPEVREKSIFGKRD